MGKLEMLFKKKLEKVNVQVAILTCALVIFSCFIIYFVINGIMVSLLADAYNQRADLTFRNIESHIDKKLYDEELSESGYGAVMGYLQAKKEDMAVSDIFVIKKSGDSYKYILDTNIEGDYDSLNNKKIRGKIKSEVEDLYVVNHVDSGFFTKMDEGYRYVNFFPVSNDSGGVKGVIGIAIDTQNVYLIRIMLRILSLIIVLICCIISIRFSKLIFKKISNPLYQDASNTDSLTGLKNKNSFSVDLHNIEAGNTERYAISTIDLNGLKHINDTRGHQAGDLYIQRAGTVLKNAMKGTSHVGYRMGGDEFAVVMKDVEIEDIKNFIERVNQETENVNKNSGLMVSMSIGYAKFNKDKDRNFSMTMERSDAMMYENKRLYYKEKNQTPR